MSEVHKVLRQSVCLLSQRRTVVASAVTAVAVAVESASKVTAVVKSVRAVATAAASATPATAPDIKAPASKKTKLSTQQTKSLLVEVSGTAAVPTSCPELGSGLQASLAEVKIVAKLPKARAVRKPKAAAEDAAAVGGDEGGSVAPPVKRARKAAAPKSDDGVVKEIAVSVCF